MTVEPQRTEAKSVGENVTGQPSGAAPCKLRTGSFRENTLAIIPDQKVPQRTLPNFAKSDILCHHGDGSDIVVSPFAFPLRKQSDTHLGLRRTYAEVLSSPIA